jgi:hypothetical protein
MNKADMNNLPDGTRVVSPSGIEYETASHACGNRWLQQTRRNKQGQSYGSHIPTNGTTRTFEGWEVVESTS